MIEIELNGSSDFLASTNTTTSTEKAQSSVLNAGLQRERHLSRIHYNRALKHDILPKVVCKSSNWQGIN